MKTKTAIFGAMALLSAGLALAAEPVRLSDETDEAKTARMAWWMHDRFGMFIHFGLYSLPGRHEWVKSLEQMDNAAYEKYFRLFDPDRLDVREWVRQAKRSGMKYVVLTTKHHEGFCLFDSKLTDYKITNTKYGKDLVREYVEACRAEGLKVGFYYSLPDWHHAEFPIDHYHPQRPVTWGPWDKRSQDVPQTEWDKVNVGRDMAKYREYLYGQVTELLTNYGKVDLLWFDFTRPEAEKFTKHAEDWEAEKLLALVRRLQPGIVVNDRLGLGETTVDGWDFVTPEQIVPNHWEMRHGKRVPWETCQTFSGSWGYHRDESTWKSPKDCIALLVRTVSFGGNLIMNVGPTGRGNFDGRACDRLDAYASWMSDHARAIYGCTAAPAEFSAPAGTFLTYNPGRRRLYLHLVDYPSEPLGLGFADRVEYAQFINDFSELSFDAEGRLRLPKAAPPVLVPVVECFLKSESEACATNEEVVFACETAGVARAQNAEGVDPFIGTSGLGHVTPAAAAPFGMVQAGPDTSGNPDRFVADWAHTGGYQHGDEWLWRFSQTHISGTGCPSLGDFGLLPYVDGFDGATNPARMVKETERAEPGFYAVVLDEDGARIGCEVSALAHSAVYRFLYPKGKRVKMLLDLDWGMGDVWKSGCWGRRVEACECVFTSERSVRGGRRMWNWNDYRIYFAMEFSAPVVTRRRLRDADGVRGEVYEIDFGISENGVLEVRLGLSFGSSEAAAKNLAAEMPRFDFAAVRMKSTADWNEVLSRVELAAGASDAVAKSFRSALYRTMFQPNLVSDVGDPPRYSTFSLWDTFRAAHPLYTLVAAERVADFVNSMLDQYDRQGYLPIWAIGGNDNHCMIGHHAVPVIADAYLKGIKGVDWVRAFAAVKNSLTINHKAANEGTWGLLKEDWDLLDKYGYYPFDLMRGEYGGMKVKGESVARLLECAYDDACAARMAEGLGKAMDAAFFHKRSSNWRNGFDPAVGFMRGKDSSGQWREPFDPYALGMGPWRDNDFCEGNSWQYSWHVMQDVDGLVAALGGKTDALRLLDRLFAERPPDQFRDGDAHDVSGAIGQYVHGNEPSHHIAYFYSLLGRADRTAEVVRRIFDTQYFSRPDGLCGNDDCGQMAAWYVFSALGFYPFDPCGGEYVIGAPQVPKVTLNLANGKTLTMTAKNLSKENKYVKSVTLNGKLIVDWKIRHAEILKGGKLVFEMVGNLAGTPQNARQLGICGCLRVRDC